MKMKNILLVFGLMLLGAFSAIADNEVSSIFLEGTNGTTSATVVVPAARGYANVQDLAWRVDAGNATATVDIRTGRQKVPINSATSGSGTVVWFDNDPTLVNNNDYILFQDTSAGTYLLMRVTGSGSATASASTFESTGVATTTSDFIWTLRNMVRRPAPEWTSSGTQAIGSLWLPAEVPTALTIDGNTTSCRISVSGIRTPYR